MPIDIMYLILWKRQSDTEWNKLSLLDEAATLDCSSKAPFKLKLLSSYYTFYKI